MSNTIDLKGRHARMLLVYPDYTDRDLKGKMTGSMNETKTDIRTYGFEFKVSGLESMDDYKIGKVKKIN